MPARAHSSSSSSRSTVATTLSPACTAARTPHAPRGRRYRSLNSWTRKKIHDRVCAPVPARLRTQAGLRAGAPARLVPSQKEVQQWRDAEGGACRPKSAAGLHSSHAFFAPIGRRCALHSGSARPCLRPQSSARDPQRQYCASARIIPLRTAPPALPARTPSERQGNARGQRAVPD